MRSFKTFAENPKPPHNESINDDEYVLAEDWNYIYEDGFNIFRKMYYKAGIIYDSASVPNSLGMLGDLHPNGVLRPASLPHDVNFIFQGKNFPKGMQFIWDEDINGWIPDNKKWTLKTSDLLFRRINYEYDKMPKWKTKWSYRILKLGSWWAWRSDDINSRKQIMELYK